MKVYFRSLKIPAFALEIDPTEVTIESLTDRLLQDKSPDESLFFIFAGNTIKTTTHLRNCISCQKGDIKDPILIIFKKNVIRSTPKIIEKPTLGLMDTFEEIVKSNPNSLAVTYDNNIFTYEELNNKSNQLANFLNKNYKINNKRVAIIGKNKLEMLICELAILKAGGTFVPFDNDIPVDRLEFTLTHANPSLLLTCDFCADKIAKTIDIDVPTINLEEIKEDLKNLSTDNLNLHTSDNENAYILYTSGSTSTQPKGVVQTRLGLFTQIKNYTENLKITDKDNFLQLATFSHDQAIVDIYGALLNGAGLHLVNFEIESLDVNKLQKEIFEKKITIYSSIPSVFSIIFDNVNDDRSFPNLRIVTLGGEAVKNSHVKLYQKIASPSCLFVNGYGATEFSWISYFVINKCDFIPDTIPLGIMSPNTKVFLDKSVTENENEGELCVSSLGVAKEYYNNYDATSNAFFKDEDGNRYYRTGDIVKVDGNGIYHFKGRMAWHEKIDGHRVNIKDVEDCMLSILPLNECVILAFGDPLRLHAFYTSHSEPLSDIEIKNSLKKHLKAYEIPFKFHYLEKFPLLPNSKIDRQKLKNLLNEKEVKQKEIQENLSIDFLSKALCEILDLDQLPNRDADFFMEMGMSSIDSVRLMNKLNDYLYHLPTSLRLTIHNIYLSRSLSSLAKFINDQIELLKKEEPVVVNPHFEEKPILNYTMDGKILKDLENNTLTFSFESLVTLAHFYNKKYNIKIIPCETKDKFYDEIKKFLEKKEYGQIGLTIPKIDKDSHHTACILNYNQDGASLYITDSIGLLPTLLEDKLFSVKVYFDPTPRQKDEFSCFIDLLTYLKDGLRLDMANEILIPFTEKSDRYLEEIKTYQKNYNFIHIFQNPPELLKHVQFMNLSKRYDNPNIETLLKNTKRPRSLEEYRNENIKESPHEETTTYEIYMKKKNISLYKKAKVFKSLLEQQEALDNK